MLVELEDGNILVPYNTVYISTNFFFLTKCRMLEFNFSFRHRERKNQLKSQRGIAKQSLAQDVRTLGMYEAHSEQRKLLVNLRLYRFCVLGICLTQILRNNRASRSRTKSKAPVELED
jgi:hypothetical protein